MNTNKKYFRPSSRAALNIHKLPKSGSYIHLKDLMTIPYQTVIHFFSTLREAENMLPDKMGGCGTIGMAKEPYPIAYQFLSEKYKGKLSYSQFLQFFEGIGHINLLKLLPVSKDQLFYELETIEGSDRQMTYFAYYYGFIRTIRDLQGFKIDEIIRNGEDFLCAPYHGWYHDADANVGIRYGEWCHMIKQRYKLVKQDFIKYIRFLGNDHQNYMIVFVELTNGTDFEVGQFIWKDGQWVSIHINPEDCIDEIHSLRAIRCR